MNAPEAPEPEADPEPPQDVRQPWAAAWRRVVGATLAVSALAVGIYWLLQALDASSGLISFAFLLVLPAAISAFVALVGDPWGERDLGWYVSVPFWLLAGLFLLAIFILHEGAICVLMLAPLWLLSGEAGSLATYRIRRRIRRRRLYSAALLAVPLLAIQLEPLLTLPVRDYTVTRSIEIDAPAQAIWPLLRGIRDVRPGEGRWNFAQDVVGVPRPLGASLDRDGIGATRSACWEHDVRFGERITEWRPLRRIGWRFVFGDMSGWDFTDPHLRPDSDYFRIVKGGYSLEPLGGGRSRLSIDTTYRARTPVNAYAALWGEVFLGGIKDNLLALVRHRAENGGSAE